MGERDLDRRPAGLRRRAPRRVHLRTRDPHEALAELYARDRQHVFLEGGPTLAAAFLRAGLVDEVVAYVAPMLLGAGRSAVGRPRHRHHRRRAATSTVTDVTVLGAGDGEQPTSGSP